VLTGCTTAERQPSRADHIDARRDLGEMRGIAVTDRRAKGGEPDAARDGGQRRQDCPAFQLRLVRRADARDLDHVIHDREPGKAAILRPPRLCLHRLECLGRIGTVEPGRVVNAELHGCWPLLRLHRVVGPTLRECARAAASFQPSMIRPYRHRSWTA